MISLLFASTAEGIVGTDNHGNIHFVNKAACRQLGYQSEEDMQGMHLDAVMTPSKMKLEIVMRRVISMRGIYNEADAILTHKSGVSIPAEIHLHPIIDNQDDINGAVLTFIDISMRKEAESLLHETLTNLDYKVKERTRDLNERMQELKETRNELIETEKMASLGRLVAGFAHEINTPIGVAVGASSHAMDINRMIQGLLQQDEVEEERLMKLLGDFDEVTELSLNNLRRAADLISSFKRTSVDQSSEIGRLFNLKETIQDVLNSLQSQFKRTRITIHLECEIEGDLWGYPGIIDQLLTNLLLNGLIHAFHEGEMQGDIFLSCLLREGLLNLHYRDNGRGMDEGSRKRLFEPFYTTRRSAGGSGLGMYICYNLVTGRLNGQISCESRLGEGTDIDILFPLEKRPEYLPNKRRATDE